MPTDYAPPTYDEIRTALSYIPTPSSYADWYPMAYAIKDALGENGKDLWHDWSRQGDNYKASVAEATWKSAKSKAGGITVATLFKQARDNGYRPDKPTAVLTPEQFAQRALETATKNEIFAASDAVRYQAAAKLAHTIWRNSKALTAADLAHPYLRNKGIQDVTAVAGIRINRYQGQNKLVIPVYLRDEQTGKTELVNLQQIDEHGTKRFLYGGQKSGGYAILNGTHADMKDGFYLAEGYATAASVHLATGKPVVIAFDAGNLPVVAARIAERDNLPSDTPIYLAADNDRVSQTGLTKATEAAAWLGERAQIRLPEFNAHDITTWQQQHGQLDADGKEQFPSDFNDLMELRGLDAVTTAIHAPLSAERAAQVASMQPEINERIAHFKDYNIQPSRPFQFETLPLDEAGLRFRANWVLEKFGGERNKKHRHALIDELAKRGIDIRAQVAELSGQQVESVEQPQRQPENEQSGLGQNPNSSTEPRAERAPWGDFPPLVRNGTLDELKNNENYQAAKAGDAKAALDLVQSLLNEQTVADIQNMVGERKPIIVAIHAEEGIGRNKIPAMMAKVLSMHTGWQVDNQLLQASYAGRTGMDSSYRLAFPPAFSGEVQNGRDYLIVDDNATMGGTIASLRGYIENRGGHVIGATVMSARATGLDIVPTQKQLDAIQRKHGDIPNDYWTNTFGYGIDCLTRGEAGAIRTSPTFDDIRNRIDDARLQRSLRMGGRGTAPQPEASAPSTTENLNPNPNPPAADALNASAVGVLAKENPMAQSPTPEDIQRHAQNVAQIADAAEREAMMSEMAEQGIYVRGAVNKILTERAAEMPQQPETGQPENPPEPSQPTAADNAAVAVSEPSETQTVEQLQNQQENTMPTPETNLVLPTREAAVEYEAINRVMQASTLAEMNRIEPRPDGVTDVAQYLQEQLAKNKEQLAHETDNAQREALQDDIAVGEIAVSLAQQGLSTQQLQQRAETLLAEAQRVPTTEVENSIEFGGITQEQAQSPAQPAEAQPHLETISAAEVQENLRRAKEKERIEAAQQFTQEAAVGAAIGIAADAAIPGSSMAKTAASVAADLASDAAAEHIMQSNSAQQAERDTESTEPQNTPEASTYQKPKPILDLDYETPKGLTDRYIRMEGKYLDFKNHQTVMFEDKGKKLNTAQTNPQIINDMLDTAQAKNWDSIKISGSLEFKQQVWLEAELRGIKTTGYKPTQEDIAKRDYLLESRYRNSIEAQHQPEINKTAQQDKAQPEPSQQLDSKKTKPAPAATIDEQNAGSLFDDAPKASLPPMPDVSAALHSAADKAQALADTPQERVAASQMHHQAAHASIQQSSLKGQAIAEQSKPAQSFNPELDSARSVYLQKVETLHKDERLRLQDIEKRLARVINRYPLAEQDEFWRRHYEETANDIKGGKLHNAEHPKQETKPSPSHTVSPSRSNQQHEQGDDGVEIGD